MADLLHAGMRRHVKIAGVDVDGVTPRDVQDAVVSSSATNMTAVLNMDPADGGAADGSVVDVAHNGLAAGSAPMDVDLTVTADADLTVGGVVTLTKVMTFTIMPEDVVAPPLASTLSLSTVGEELPKL